MSASEDVSLCEKCCSKHPEHCSNILASDVTKQQLQEDKTGWEGLTLGANCKERRNRVDQSQGRAREGAEFLWRV